MNDSKFTKEEIKELKECFWKAAIRTHNENAENIFKSGGMACKFVSSGSYEKDMNVLKKLRDRFKFKHNIKFCDTKGGGEVVITIPDKYLKKE